jgi:translocator protein
MQPVLAIVIAFVTCFGLPILLGANRKSYGQEWYRRLKKPSFSPPDMVFNLVFLVFYILETIGFYYILSINEMSAMLFYALWFVATVVLSALWSRLFFQYQRCDLSIAIFIIEILLLWPLIAFLYSDAIIAWVFLLPRAVWGIYAIAVNIGFYSLNRAYWDGIKTSKSTKP